MPAPARKPTRRPERPLEVRAALYIRVSTDDQELANQRPELERLASMRRLSIVARYEEHASAAKARPQFDRMLADARGGAFDVLLIWAIDRFGRSMAGNVNHVLELERVGVRVVSVRETWLDTSGPVRDLLLAIFSWIAEQERVRLGERTRAGMERARLAGKSIGRPRARVDRNAYDMLIQQNPAITLERAAARLGVSSSTLRRDNARFVKHLRGE